jgi:hypothetical protein
MSIAFVLGNGISRKQVNLSMLQYRGRTYGCNALYRDFEPDVLIATDRPIADYIQDIGYALRRRFYTRKPVAGRGAHSIPEPYYTFSSGPAAVGIALDDRNLKIYLLGFDLGPDSSKMFNNVYAGTEFYKKNGSVPTYTGNWIRQITKLATQSPKVQFVRVYGTTTARLPELDALSNMTHLHMSEFLDRINNQKDL